MESVPNRYENINAVGVNLRASIIMVVLSEVRPHFKMEPRPLLETSMVR